MVTALFGDGLGMTGNLEKEIKESILFCVMWLGTSKVIEATLSISLQMFS